MKEKSTTYFTFLTFLLISIITSSNVIAEQFVYETQCQPTEIEDVARVIQGNIYLALRADKTIKNTIVSVKIRNSISPTIWISETDLLIGTGYSFNSADLSISLGGKIAGHACFAKANLLFDIQVTRKDGTSQSNILTIPVEVPGALATKSKIVVP